MPRRSVLSVAEREGLLAIPGADEELVRAYTFSLDELALIRVRRGTANRLGFAVQLAYMRFPGVLLGTADPAPEVVAVVAAQLNVPAEQWTHYAVRAETRREHAVELRGVLGLVSFTEEVRRGVVAGLDDLVVRTDKGVVVATAVVERLRAEGVLLPPVSVIERMTAEAITRGNRLVYAALAGQLSAAGRHRLDTLLKPAGDERTPTRLGWLRQPPKRANSKHLREHIRRLQDWRTLELPVGVEFAVHRNRLLKLAREGAQMTA